MFKLPRYLPYSSRPFWWWRRSFIYLSGLYFCGLDLLSCNQWIIDFFCMVRVGLLGLWCVDPLILYIICGASLWSLYFSEMCRLFRLSNFPSFCISTMLLRGSVYLSITVDGSHVSFSWRANTLLSIVNSERSFAFLLGFCRCCCCCFLGFFFFFFLLLLLLMFILSRIWLSFGLLVFNNVGILVLVFLPYRISGGDGKWLLSGVVLRLNRAIWQSIFVLLFLKFSLLSRPHARWIHSIVSISGLMWWAGIPPTR